MKSGVAAWYEAGGALAASWVVPYMPMNTLPGLSRSLDLQF